MMAIIGMFFQDGLTGSAWGDWSLYTDSPLRASPEEIMLKGGMGSVGGGTGVGSFTGSSSSSSSSAQSASVSTTDLGVQAPVGFWDPLGLSKGYLSPSLGLKFSDVPNGLAAISKVLGWLQILWFIGLIEGSGFFSGKYGLGFMKDATMAGTPGDYG
ncbi:FCPF, partial [Symbiodinium pilosum]